MSESVQYAPFKARHVMGSLFEVRTKDHTGADLEPNKYHYFVGFAVPKGPEWDKISQTMYQAAAGDPACGAALCGQAGFNWKIEDADAPSNPENLGKASYPAGHMIIKFNRMASIGPVPVVDGRGMAVAKEQVKRGDHYWIAASTRFNGAKTVKTNAGMYQNIEGVMYAEAGEEIASEGGFNAAAAFAGIQGGMAPAAHAPAGGAMMGSVPTGNPVASMPGSVPTGNPAASMPGAAGGVPTSTPVPSVPAAQPVKVYKHTSTQFTKEQLQNHSAAWTEAALVQAGYGVFEEVMPEPAASVPTPGNPGLPTAPTAGGVTPAPDFLNQPGYRG